MFFSQRGCCRYNRCFVEWEYISVERFLSRRQAPVDQWSEADPNSVELTGKLSSVIIPQAGRCLANWSFEIFTAERTIKTKPNNKMHLFILFCRDLSFLRREDHLSLQHASRFYAWPFVSLCRALSEIWPQSGCYSCFVV